MKSKQVNNKFKDLDSKPVSKWVDESDLRLANINRPRYSQQVAIKILRTLREKNLKQKDLADILNVSPQTVNKWVKGSENFTLDTIERLEIALGIKLMYIYSSNEIPKAKITSKISVSTFQSGSAAMISSSAVSLAKKETKVISLNAYISDAVAPELNYCNF